MSMYPDPVALSALRRWRQELPHELARQVADLEGRPELDVLLSAVGAALAEYFQRHWIANATSLNLTQPYGRTLLHHLVAKHLALGFERPSMQHRSDDPRGAVTSGAPAAELPEATR